MWIRSLLTFVVLPFFAGLFILKPLVPLGSWAIPLAMIVFHVVRLILSERLLKPILVAARRHAVIQIPEDQHFGYMSQSMIGVPLASIICGMAGYILGGFSLNVSYLIATSLTIICYALLDRFFYLPWIR